jgi:plasmid stabilization system protein ParE
MKRPVVWSQSALDDLEGIIGYIAARNPSAALRVIDRIEQAGEDLGNMDTGRHGRVAGTYEKVVTGLPYILAYATHTAPDGEETVVILRAIHGARDWPPNKWPK